MIHTTNLNRPSYPSSSSHSSSSSSKPSEIGEKVKNVTSQVNLNHTSPQTPRSRSLSLQEKFLIVDELRQGKEYADIAKSVGRNRSDIVEVHDSYSKDPQKYEKQFQGADFYAQPLAIESQETAKPQSPTVASKPKQSTHFSDSLPTSSRETLTLREQFLIVQSVKDKQKKTGERSYVEISEQLGKTYKKVANFYLNRYLLMEKFYDEEFEKAGFNENPPKVEVIGKDGDVGTKRKPDENLNLQDEASPQKKKKISGEKEASLDLPTASKSSDVRDSDQEMTPAEQTSELNLAVEKTPKQKSERGQGSQRSSSMKSIDSSRSLTLEEQFAIVQSVKKNGKTYLRISQQLDKDYNAVSNFYHFVYSKAPEEHETRFRKAGLYNSKSALSAEKREASRVTENSSSSSSTNSLQESSAEPETDVVMSDVTKVASSIQQMTQSLLPESMIDTEEPLVSQYVAWSAQVPVKPLEFPHFDLNLPLPPLSLDEAFANSTHWVDNELDQIMDQQCLPSIDLLSDGIPPLPKDTFKSCTDFDGLEDIVDLTSTRLH